MIALKLKPKRKESHRCLKTVNAGIFCIMFILRRNVFEIWICFAIYFLWLMTFVEGEEGRTVNIKLGFDIVPRANGNPSLRIREFKGPRVGNLRKFGKKSENSQLSVRAEYTSVESDDDKNDDKDEKLARESNDDDVDESSESEDRAQRSTKGINPEEFEPNRNPSGMHGRERVSGSDTGER